METVTMSRKEVLRAGLVRAALAGKITNAEGAGALHLTVRQFKRLKARVRTEGVAGLPHRARGRPGRRHLGADLREQVVTLMTTVYDGFNDVHLTEKLRERHALPVSRATVRRLRLALGRPARRRRRAPKHRSRRDRAPALGQLAQLDGSPFAWFEERGPVSTLHGVIDDATSLPLALGFRPTEDLHGYFTVLRQVCRTYGVPTTRRSAQCLSAQRSPLDTGGRAAGQARSHALRPGAPGPGRRIHRRAVAAGQRPHRAAVGHAARSAHQRAAAARHRYPRGRQRLSAGVPGGLPAPFPHAPGLTHRGVAPSPVRSRADPQLSLSPRRRTRQHRAARRALAPSAAGARRRLLCRPAPGSPRTARWAPGRDARRPAARHAALSLAGLRPHPTYCPQRGSSPPRGVPRRSSATAAGACAARHAPRCSAHATTAASPLAACLQTRNAAVPSHQGVTFSLNSYGDIFTGQRQLTAHSALR